MSAQYHKRPLLSHRKGNEIFANFNNNNNNNNMYMTNQADIDHLVELPTMRCL